MLFSKSISSLKAIMKNSYGDLNRLTSSENISLGTKSSPSSSQGTSPAHLQKGRLHQLPTRKVSFYVLPSQSPSAGFTRSKQGFSNEPFDQNS